LTTQSPLKKVLKNATILFSGNMGANILGLLSVAVFTHSQGAEVFGYYVLFLTFIEIIDRVFNFQTWQAFIKFATDFQVKNEHHNLMMLLKYSFLVDLISLIVATFVALFLSSFAMDFFNIPHDYYVLLLLMSLTILFKTTEISAGVFRLYDRFKVQAKIAVYSSAIKFAMFCMIALFAPSFEMFVYATVLAQFITMMMKYFYAKSVLYEHNITIVDVLKEKVNVPLLKELKIFSFIVYNNFDVAVRMLSRQLDTVILGKLYGAEVVGIYKIAKEVANLMAKLTDPVYQAIYPEFAKMLANGKKLEAKQMAIKISFYAGVVGFIFYGLFTLLGEWAIGLAFGSEFLEAYQVSMIYMIAILIAMISLPLPSLMHSFGLAKYAFINQVTSVLIYVIISVILISKFSMIGAAVSMIIFHIIWLIIAIMIVKNQFKEVTNVKEN
jgi:O-antigen/teichoic acid export membrane protein